jgi:hypothetical protein
MSVEFSDSDEPASPRDADNDLEEYVLVGRSGSGIVHRAMNNTTSSEEWAILADRDCYLQIHEEDTHDEDVVTWATAKCGVRSKTLYAASHGSFPMKDRSSYSRRGC